MNPALLMSYKLDQTQDKGAIEAVCRRYGVSPPGKEKVASSGSQRGSTRYAIQVEGLDGKTHGFWPVTTSEDTRVSMAFYRRAVDTYELPMEMVKIAACQIYRAMRRHYIPVPVSEQLLEARLIDEVGDRHGRYVQSKLGVTMKPIDAQPERVKVASARPEVRREDVVDWALPHKKRFPLDHPVQVQEANTWLEKYAHTLSDVDRITYARNVRVRSQQLGIPVGKEVTASAKTVAAATILEQIENRRTHVRSVARRMPHEEAAQYRAAGEIFLEKLAHIAPNTSGDSLVEMIHVFDEEMDIDNMWGKGGIADPIRAVYGTAGNDVLLQEVLPQHTERHPFQERLVNPEVRERLSTYVGDDMANELQRDPAKFARLPEATRQVVAMAINPVDDDVRPPAFMARGQSAARR